MPDVSTQVLRTLTLSVPEIILVLGACLVWLGGTIWPRRHLWASAAILALGVALAVACCRPAIAPEPYTSALVSGALLTFVRVVAIVSGVVFVCMIWNRIEDRHAGDYYGCLLTITAGVSLIGGANDLVVMFLALELVSIPTYVILYLPRHDLASQEAAVKYFLLSVFSSALVLFGMSYLYGLIGSTNLAVIQHTLNGPGIASGPPLMAQVSLIFILGGLGFRLAAVPFHFYAPDVYQGAGNEIAAILALIPKVAGFAALFRLLGFAIPLSMPTRFARIGEMLSLQTPIILWFLAAITMTLGNVLALRQKHLRRMLAYSSIAHAGYMLIALAAAPFLREESLLRGVRGPDGVATVLFYLVAYGATTVGAFAVLSRLDSEDQPVETVDDLAGLGRSHPLDALALTVFMFSLIGIPFTAGFVGKLLVFMGAIAVPGSYATLFRVLAVIGVLNAAIGAWYYLRVIGAMYLRTAVEPIRKPREAASLVAIAACIIVTVGAAIPPGSTWLLQASNQAAEEPLLSQSSQQAQTDPVAEDAVRSKSRPTSQ